MSLKNLDKVGLGLDLSGKTQYIQKIQNPKMPTESSSKIGTVATFSKRIEENSEKVESSSNSATTLETKVNQKKYQVVSSTNGSDLSFGGNITTSAIQPVSIYMGVLEGIIGKNDWKTKHKIYRDIYTYDLAGAIVDIISMLPYSDFNLVGISDDKILQEYMDILGDLHLQEMLPSITTDYLVMGTFVGSLGWNDAKNRFSSMVPQDLDFCEIYDLGIPGVDPVINVELSDHYKSILEQTGPRFERMKKQLPDYLRNLSDNGKLELDPFYTLYVARRGLTNSMSDSNQADTEHAGSGNSYFNRILTIYLLEKALIKGTIESAQRRQRAITHITAGTEDWVPTDDELNQLSELFLTADLDPISAQVVTRSGVEANSVKSGDDFWKWNDIFDFTTGAKLKALGVNESILSGDASFNTLDAAISSFMESISQTRDIVTNQVFYNKICPIIAYKNDFKKEKKDKQSILSSVKQRKDGSLVGRLENPLFSTTAGNIPEIEDLSEYLIPQIQFTKNLKPEVDKDYLEILETLEEKGIPIPLRIWAAAGGENIDELINALDDDNELRLEIAEKKKDLIDDAVKEKLQQFLGIENIEELLPPDSDIEAKLKTLGGMGSVDRTKKARNLEALRDVYDVREYDATGKRRILTKAQKDNITDKVHHQVAAVLAEKGKEYNEKLKNGD